MGMSYNRVDNTVSGRELSLKYEDAFGNEPEPGDEIVMDVEYRESRYVTVTFEYCGDEEWMDVYGNLWDAMREYEAAEREADEMLSEAA